MCVECGHHIITFKLVYNHDGISNERKKSGKWIDSENAFSPLIVKSRKSPNSPSFTHPLESKKFVGGKIVVETG